MKPHFKFYRVGQTWILSLWLLRFGLIHLGSPYWWKPITTFPMAFWKHCRVLLAPAREPSDG
jgi:hypothetical protein